MEQALDVLKDFDSYCKAEREKIDRIEDKEQKACREKALIARTLLYREAADAAEAYAKYAAIRNDKSEVKEFMGKIRGIEGLEVKREFLRECEIGMRMSDYHSAQLWKLQEALSGMICAGLEDISFDKWKINFIDAVRDVKLTEQANRMPHFLKACADAADSLDADFPDVEEERRAVLEPERVYNTLVLTAAAVKCYRETLEKACNGSAQDFGPRCKVRPKP